MPRNQFQRMVFAFIAVVITVHAFVFYNIYVLNGDMLRSFNYTSSVLTAVNKHDVRDNAADLGGRAGGVCICLYA